ncbi:MAG: UvrD-helicase domain-containing protein [Gammaproteobacteria bacterium]|nr:UvrD-helicase domain-containing protein [Gammaproteobacteria bacterium]
MTHDAALLAADEQARKEALDVTRSFIVQAPAGSGKTELLIQRYLRLLATVDSPEEVIAITFTRKAAAEMQYRVLHALRRSQRGDVPEAPHHRVTAVAAAAALERDQEKGWQIIANPRRMRIQTLDSLNASIARMQPLTGAATSGNSVANDAEVKALYRAAAAATLDWLAEPGTLRDAVQQILLHLDNNTSLFVGYLARMLETRDQWLPFVGSGNTGADAAMRERLEGNLRGVVTAHLERTRHAFPVEVVPDLLALAGYASARLIDAGKADHPVAALHELHAMPPASSESLDAWRGIATLLLTAGGGWRKRVNVNDGFPAGDDGQKAALYDVIESASGHAGLRALLHGIRTLPPVAYSDEQWYVLLALLRLLPMAVAELQQLFSAHHKTDFIEIALAADHALGSAESPGDIALLLDYQVRHVLIDEMQDTSRAQYRMLEALTGGWEPGDGRTLFCVGDPMQSIYRFRNAEVAQFLLAQRKGIGGLALERLVLRKNFRSGEFLVHWLNTVFPQVLPAADDPARGAVSYTEAVPALSSEGDCRVYPLFGADPAREAAEGCRIIQETLARNPEDDMAVLVRGRTQLASLLPQLRAAGVHYQAVDIDRLTDLPEIIDLLALTRAMVHPCDRLAWLALLRGPWMGWDWTDLHTLVANDTKSTVWELLHDGERIQAISGEARASLNRAMPVLESLRAASRSASLRDRVEGAWLRLGGPAILDNSAGIENVYRYLDVLEKLEIAGTLHDVAELEAQLDLERVSNNSSARLQVMTMHRAKGLQFDHVLLFGLGRIPRGSDRSVLSWFDVPGEHGDEEKIISPVGRRADLENDPIHRFIELTEAGKDRHEVGRLLYVACTRARKSLHLIGHTAVSPDGESWRPPDARSLLSLLWPAIESQFEQAFEPQEAAASITAADQWVLPQRRRIEPVWQLPDVPPVPGQEHAADAGGQVRAVDYHWVGTEARIAGTIVHRWLQYAAQDGAGPDAFADDGLRKATDRWLGELGVAPGATMERIRARVDEALRSVRNDPRGRWLLSGGGHAELALSGVVNGVVESGIMDRIRIDDATHWIVDYKTSSHEGGNLEGFLAAEVERYRDQLARYAALYGAYAGVDVRCALYFPLLQQFVEVDVET